MDWFQFSIFLLFVSTIGLGIIHGIEKIARILDHHFSIRKDIDANTTN
jgi:hypothetical protein